MPEGRDAKSGICRRNGELVCGLPESRPFCDAGSWEPPFEVAHAGHPHRICAYYPYGVRIGRCGRDGPCANRAERCEDPDGFVERDEGCSLTHDSREKAGGAGEKVTWEVYDGTDGSAFAGWTTYGSCDGRCVWSSDDCAESESYVRDDPSCTADKVKLGACVDGYAYCVVSEENCAGGKTGTEPYYSHQELLDKFDVDCYLSALPKLIAPKPPTPPPDVAEVPAEASASADDGVPSAPPPDLAKTPAEARASADGGGLSDGALIGICVGSAVAAFVLALVAQRHLQRKRRLREEWEIAGRKGAPCAPPAKSVALPGPDGGAGTQDEEDNVSEL